MNDWLTTHKLTLNVSKTKLMVIARRQKLARVEEIELLVNENTIEQTDTFKYLGVKLNETMEWSDHIDYIHSKVAKRLGLPKRAKHLLQRNHVQRYDPTNFGLRGHCLGGPF